MALTIFQEIFFIDELKVLPGDKLSIKLHSEMRSIEILMEKGIYNMKYTDLREVYDEMTGKRYFYIDG